MEGLFPKVPRPERPRRAWRPIWLGLLLALCLGRTGLGQPSLVGQPSLGQPVGEREQDRPGAFDFYLMSFSIAPSFCALSPRNAEKQECHDGTDEGYRAIPLTVHGLWPNRERVSVNQQPQYCSEERLGRLPPELRAQLARYMPSSADGLDTYEWRRHGTCSGLAPEVYFGTIVRLAEQANATIGAVLRDSGAMGRELRIDDLVAAVAAKDPALASAIVVTCRFPRGEEAERRALVEEIRVVMTKDFKPAEAERVGFRQNSGCPGRAGYLPAGFAGHS